MREYRGKTYWLVGASEGLGAQLAAELHNAGAKLILSARNKDALEAIAGPEDVVLPLDVTDTQSVNAAIEQLPPFDGMVYLAAAYWPMDSRDWDLDKSLAMIEVGLSGAMRVLAGVIPKMMAQGHGHIVLTGSLAAFGGLPAAVGYGASKAGLASLAETLRIDLAGTGICVQLANPGFIKTRLTAKNDFNMPAIMSPQTAAQHMMKHMSSDRFRYSFPFWFSLVFRIARVLPDALYFRLFQQRVR